ncbi:MAG: ferritin family protein [Elusimicrobia bacterium]|jgi:rubrerythrin|nr:ferritin family protein [Elusimicrobiota bacterium]
MGSGYSPQELLHLALGVEQSGRQVYEHFEKNAKNPELKKTWALLKEDEAEHSRVFQDLLREVAPGQAAAAPPSPYLKAVASSCIFSESRLARMVLKGLGSDSEALEFGIFFEKESIFTYITLQERLTGDAGRLLDRIIAEEKRHLIRLTGLLDRA